ncbi:MAG: glycosyltransferase family 4 protein [Candidatus Zipacnadales bacterium]
MIRIAQVVEAVEGGCKRHVMGLAEGLDPARFSQTVIFSPHRDADFARAIAATTGGTVETVAWDVRRDVSFAADWKAYRFLQHLLAERKFDVIHSHSAKAGFLARMAARRLSAARVYTPHCFPFCMKTSSFRRHQYLWAERLVGRYTDCLVAVSPSEAELAVQMRIVPRERVIIVENGLDLTPLDAPVDIAEKKQSLGISPTQPVILAVGALRPQKGMRYLIEAVPRLAVRYPELQVLIAGEGELRGELAELIARLGVGKHVRLLGMREDVPELLRIADCFVLPSLWEGGPYALLEAMAAGTPVVGSRIKGIIDWVTEGKTGRLAEPGSSDSLAKAVEETLADPPGSRQMAVTACAMVRRRNTLDRWLADMARLYEKLVAACR